MTVLPFQSFLFFQGNDGALLLCCGAPILVVLIVIIVHSVATSREQAEEAKKDAEATANMTDEEKAAYFRQKEERKALWDKIKAEGYTSPKMVCPHCQKKGGVRTKSIEKKKGISGSKATGAVLTGGLSVWQLAFQERKI